MIIQHAELTSMWHGSDDKGKKVSFAKTQWENMKNGTWRKVVYKQEVRHIDNIKLEDWELHRILKEDVSEKEYFKRILSGKT